MRYFLIADFENGINFQIFLILGLFLSIPFSRDGKFFNSVAKLTTLS